MISIGLTGGIGSGKTFVCEVFKKLGVPVFHADPEAKKLINNSEKIRNKFINLYGKDIYLSNSLINSERLAEIIFNDKKELERINGIVHPEVFKAIKEFQDLHAAFSYIIIEAAILFESKADKLVDKVIVVEAPVEIRIKRVMERDHVERKQVMSRIENQLTDKERAKRADYVIYNDDGRMLFEQILEIHNNLK